MADTPETPPVVTPDVLTLRTPFDVGDIEQHVATMFPNGTAAFRAGIVANLLAMAEAGDSPLDWAVRSEGPPTITVPPIDTPTTPPPVVPTFLPTTPPPWGGIGLSELTLANGVRLSLADYIWGSLRSAFVVDPQGEGDRWVAFSYGPSQRIAGGSFTANRAHTNVPRNGDSGLPKDWAMFVRRWRAHCDMPLLTPLLNFAAETTVEFQYNNDKRYASSTLLDLLMGQQHIADDDTRPHADVMGLPVHMREGLNYEVVVECRSSTALDELREHLRQPLGVAADLERLEQLAIDLNHDATRALAAEIARMRTRLPRPRPLLCWVHLEGYLLRVVS
jgi:hypothetical protein